MEIERVMSTNLIHLWVAYPDDLKDKPTANACARLLSEEERARWQRFKFDRHKREFLATRALQRSALSAYADIAPQAWRFEAGQHGKPFAAQAPDLEFNLSNSLGLVVCAVTHGCKIGVDVEPHSRAATIEEVAEKFFSARELEQLLPLRGEERRERCLTLWTLKEAFMKAHGLGMALPTKLFSFVFQSAPNSGDTIRLETDAALADNPERWQFCSLDYAQHRIAIMIESNRSLELDAWEARPLLNAPTPLPISDVRWHPAPARTT
jgi:4'-phosphopantetheinyl transferase